MSLRFCSCFFLFFFIPHSLCSGGIICIDLFSSSLPFSSGVKSISNLKTFSDIVIFKLKNIQLVLFIVFISLLRFSFFSIYFKFIFLFLYVAKLWYLF